MSAAWAASLNTPPCSPRLRRRRRASRTRPGRLAVAAPRWRPPCWTPTLPPCAPSQVRSLLPLPHATLPQHQRLYRASADCSGAVVCLSTVPAAAEPWLQLQAGPAPGHPVTPGPPASPLHAAVAKKDPADTSPPPSGPCGSRRLSRRRLSRRRREGVLLIAGVPAGEAAEQEAAASLRAATQLEEAALQEADGQRVAAEEGQAALQERLTAQQALAAAACMEAKLGPNSSAEAVQKARGEYGKAITLLPGEVMRLVEGCLRGFRAIRDLRKIANPFQATDRLPSFSCLTPSDVQADASEAMNGLRRLQQAPPPGEPAAQVLEAAAPAQVVPRSARAGSGGGGGRPPRPPRPPGAARPTASPACLPL